jgi:hypothetical protein
MKDNLLRASIMQQIKLQPVSGSLLCHNSKKVFVVHTLLGVGHHLRVSANQYFNPNTFLNQSVMHKICRQHQNALAAGEPVSNKLTNCIKLLQQTATYDVRTDTYLLFSSFPVGQYKSVLEYFYGIHGSILHILFSR